MAEQIRERMAIHALSGEAPYDWLYAQGALVFPGGFTLQRDRVASGEAYRYDIGTPEGDTSDIIIYSENADSENPTSFTAYWNTQATVPTYLGAINAFHAPFLARESHQVPQVGGILHGRSRSQRKEFTTTLPISEDTLLQEGRETFGDELAGVNFIEIFSELGTFDRYAPFRVRISSSFAHVPERIELIEGVKGFFASTTDTSVLISVFNDVFDLVSGDEMQRKQRYVKPSPKRELTVEEADMERKRNTIKNLFLENNIPLPKDFAISLLLSALVPDGLDALLEEARRLTAKPE